MLAEGDDIIVPTHYNARLEYAIAKTLTEAATINSRHRGLRGFVIRPFNVVGPRQSRAGGFVMPTFVQQAIAGRPLTVFAGGGQERAFLSATDLARFITDHGGRGVRVRPARSSTSATPPTRSRCGTWRSGSSSACDSTSPIEHADARLIHGPLYEEAESIQKLPVLDAAAAVGWAPRHHARRADRRDRALLPRPRRRARGPGGPARPGCSGLACRNRRSSSRRTRTTRPWAAPGSWPSWPSRARASTSSTSPSTASTTTGSTARRRSQQRIDEIDDVISAVRRQHDVRDRLPGPGPDRAARHAPAPRARRPLREGPDRAPARAAAAARRCPTTTRTTRPSSTPRTRRPRPIAKQFGNHLTPNVLAYEMTKLQWAAEPLPRFAAFTDITDYMETKLESVAPLQDDAAAERRTSAASSPSRRWRRSAARRSA